MTVYVDDMFESEMGKFRSMRMSHMVADTDDELHAMAERIGVARKWHQDSLSGSHYDIAMSKRALAIEFGAVPITLRQCAMMCANRRQHGTLGEPATCEAVFRARLAANNAKIKRGKASA